METHPLFMNLKINIVEMTYKKALSIFNEIPQNISMTFKQYIYTLNTVALYSSNKPG